MLNNITITSDFIRHFVKLNSDKLTFHRALTPHNYQKASVRVQILALTLLFIINVLKDFLLRWSSPYFRDGIPINHFGVFAPLYEEVIFRGLILLALTKFYSPVKAIIFSSLFFGIWHLKNIFFLDTVELVYQIIYASVIIGPVLGWLCLKTRSIWPGVIFHYSNNIWSPVSWMILKTVLDLMR